MFVTHKGRIQTAVKENFMSTSGSERLLVIVIALYRLSR